MSIEVDLCEAWPLELDECCTFPTGSEPDSFTIEAKQMEATRILWHASGRRIAACPVTVRPCLRRCDGGGGLPSVVRGSGTSFINVGCGCPGDCSCTSLCEVILPGPVASVTEVLLDGVVFDDWRLDRVGGMWTLLRTDGGCWPSCQNQRLDPDQEGTFAVTYDYGIVPDELAVAAVSELTCELVKACLPGCECRLPKNVQRLSRQGVELTFEDSATWLKSLPSVLVFLDAHNPHGLTSDPEILSPDLPQPRITVQETSS